MKIQTECVPCLLKRVIFETEQNTDDPELKKRVIQNACEVLSNHYYQVFHKQFYGLLSQWLPNRPLSYIVWQVICRFFELFLRFFKNF